METDPVKSWLQAPLGEAPPWLALGLECALAIVLGLVAHSLLLHLMRRMAGGFVVARTLVDYGRHPTQLLLPLLFIHIALDEAPASLVLINPLRHLLTIALLTTLTVLCIRLVKGAAEAVIARYPTETAGDPYARSVHTQARVLSRTLMALVGMIGAASILMTFPGVRQVGASLLASAGVAGLVAGIAARPVLGNLIAGLQIALTQPMRLGDMLIVEGECGRVEELTGSYVVVRLWDERRLVVPLEWFIQNPFQNWTRSSTELIGTVFLWVDYAMPLEPLRQELQRVCRAAPEWDGRLSLLQVTDANERAMQLRMLVSASDASKVWDLRCRVREALVAFIQGAYADYLPRQRASFDNIADNAHAARSPAAHLSGTRS